MDHTDCSQTSEAEFKKIDWGKVSKAMRKPAWVFDSRSIIDSEDIRKYKLNLNC